MINLLKNDIDNCIAVGGATGKIPKTIIDLSKSKETTLFLDGDRGGDMILRGLLNVCDIDFVVRAPDGKEVEELTRKDIIKALRTKVPIEQVLPRLNRNGNEHRFNNFKNPDQSPPQAMQPQHSMPARQQMPEQRQQESRPGPMQRTPERPMERSTPAQRQAESDRNQILSPTEISRKLLSRDRDQ